MSYRKRFYHEVYIDYSDSAYASQAGTVNVSGTVHKTVEVVVDVDTDPFDESVDNCRAQVGGLTAGVGVLAGSVVATEQAQVESVRSNSRRVAHSIVSGFFKTVKSEISQQIAELSARIEADLVHLSKMRDRLLDKKRQMTADYNRLSSNYCRIFDDLNRELENRIFQLDEPTFKFSRQAAGVADINQAGTAVGAAAVTAAETSRVQGQLHIAAVKRDALQAMRGAERFLQEQKRVDHLLHASMLQRTSPAGMQCIPVVMARTTRPDGVIDDSINAPALPGHDIAAALDGCQDSMPWTQAAPDDAAAIQRHYDSNVARNTGADEHSRRVAAYMNSLFDLSHTASL